MNFPLLNLDWYLLGVVIGNKYLPRANGKAFYITSIDNIIDIIVAR